MKNTINTYISTFVHMLLSLFPRLEISGILSWYKYIQYRSRKQRLLSICIFFLQPPVVMTMCITRFGIDWCTYIQGKKQKRRRRKQEGKDYFGISLYRQEDIAVVVLFANNLGIEETYTHTYFILSPSRFLLRIKNHVWRRRCSYRNWQWIR